MSLDTVRRWISILEALYRCLRRAPLARERRASAQEGAEALRLGLIAGGREPLSPSLAHFQAQTGAAHAFQVAMVLPFVERDCFERCEPAIVPARTLLAQLA